MRNTFSKGLIGLAYNDFLTAFTADATTPVEIIGTQARLIPIGRKDDEMAVTSIFLSTLSLVKEFRGLVSDIAKLSKAGRLYCFTEVSFPVFFANDPLKKNNRFDGLAVVVTSGRIKDAMIFEMKIGNDMLDSKQIETYVDMAHSLGIHKIMSISNQFVPSENTYPIPLDIPRKDKDVVLSHSSWKRIMALAMVLVKDNNLNIADSDQASIMEEVVRYMADCGCIKSFDRMSKEWKAVAEDLGCLSCALDAKLKDCYEVVVRDWLQEERDIAIDLTLQLSDHEFTPVYAISSKFTCLDNLVKQSLQTLKDERKLSSEFKIKNAVSNLKVTADFVSKKIIQSMNIPVPTDKTVRGKLSFVRAFFKKASTANPVGFNSLKKDITIIVVMKRKHDSLKFPLADFLDNDKTIVDTSAQITRVDVQMETDLSTKDFESSTKFIIRLEQSVSQFYAVVMQYFEKWTPPTPKATNIQPQEDNDNLRTPEREEEKSAE
ncbi:MAG: hypothetical protein WCR76_02860 [Sphaerochaetaceae bacterium]